MEVTQLIDDNEIPLIIDQFKLEFQQLTFLISNIK